MSQVYVLIAVVALLGIAVAFILIRKKGPTPLTPLTAFAFAFMLAGIFFGDNRLIGYGLLGTGLLLAVIDVIRKLSRKNKNQKPNGQNLL